MTNKHQSSHTADASRRIAELEATNVSLREALSSKTAHIAMLEERLLTMSIELASSRAREDEQNLLLRRRSTVSPSNRRFCFKPQQSNPDLNDSQRSLGSGGGMSAIIGNILHNLDRSDNSEDLSVDFPTASRRRSSMMSDTDYYSSSCEEPSRRVSMVGSLFRLRKSELSDETVEEASCEYEVEQEEEQEEEQQPSSPQRRRPNRSLMANRCQKSSRLISSTVAFPTLDDDDSLGFE